MATVAIGDIHGNLAALDDLLGRVLPELQPEDTLVFLGDYLDRGPDVRGCIDRLLAVRADPPCQVELLLGNHEAWFLDALDDPTRTSWLVGMDGFTTIASYDPGAADGLRAFVREHGARLLTERMAIPYEPFLAAVPEEHLDLLRGLRTYVVPLGRARPRSSRL